MSQFPNRIKEITPDNLPSLRRNRDWFVIFWLAYIALNFFDPSRMSIGGRSSSIDILLPMLKFGLLIGSAIFLVKVTNRLYRNSLFSIVYILTLVLPYFIVLLAARTLVSLISIPFISYIPFLDLVRFLILLLVVVDLSNVFVYFRDQSRYPASEISDKMNRDRKNIFIIEGLVLIGFIMSIIFVLFALPEISPQLTDGFGGLIYSFVVFTCFSNFYPFYFLVRGLVIAIGCKCSTK